MICCGQVGSVPSSDHPDLHSGISRDNWHKRRKTGGKRKPYHKKRKYELGRPPANTKVGDLGRVVSGCVFRLGLLVLCFQRLKYMLCFVSG